MKIQLRFFASVRELVGSGQEVLELPQATTTVGELRALLVARGGNWAEALAEGKLLRMAHNQLMCKADTLVADGDEVAFFPPVTGG